MNDVAKVNNFKELSTERIASKTKCSWLIGLQIILLVKGYIVSLV